MRTLLPVLRTALVTVALLPGAWPAARAQQLAPALASWTPAADAESPEPVRAGPTAGLPQSAAPRSALTVGLGGLAGAAVGVVVGGAIGAAADRADGCDDDWCGLSGWLAGSTIGSTLLTPAGAHLANDRRGSLPLGLAASAGVAAVLWIAADRSEAEELVLAIPIAQVITSTLLERATSH